MRRTEAPGSIGGLYYDRNTTIGREGTLILSENMNDFQEEIARTIEKSGRSLDSGDREQLSKSVVLTGGDPQSISGVKTFVSIPVLPSSNPTSSNQAVRKGYVDSMSSGLSDDIAGVNSDLSALSASAVKLTGDQTISGKKTFYEADIDLLAVGSGGLSIVGGLSVGGAIQPRATPVLGSISVGTYYTPARGLYNSSWASSNRGSTYNPTAGASRGGDGPYSGTTDTQIYHTSAGSATWYYARF